MRQRARMQDLPEMRLAPARSDRRYAVPNNEVNQESVMSQSKEAIYDEQISPLMKQIIAICQSNDIKMLASFALVDNDGEELACTTALLDGLPADNSMVQALRVIKPRVHAFAFAISSAA